MQRHEIIETRRALAAKIKEIGDRFISRGSDWEGTEQADWTAACSEYDELTARLQEADQLTERMADLEGERTRSASGPNPATGDTRYQREIGEGGENRARDFFGDVVSFRASDGREIAGRSGTAPLQRNQDGPGLGELLHASLTGDLQRSEFRGALGGVDSQGGFLLSPTMSGRFVDLARSASVVARAGAITVPVESAEMTMVQLTGDPSAYWRPEAVLVNPSQPAFGRITLRPRTLAAIVPVSIELLEDSGNAQQIIESSLRNAMALQIDQAALLGSGAQSEPRGIAETEGINEITSVGTPADFGPYSRAVQKVQEANFPGEPSELAWIGHPRDFGLLDRAVDGEGRQVRPTMMVEPVRKLATTSIPTTLGGGTESLAIVGDFRQLVLGMRYRQVQIRVLDAGTVGELDIASSLQKLIVAHIRVDVAVIRPTWFTKLSGITAVEG